MHTKFATLHTKSANLHIIGGLYSILYVIMFLHYKMCENKIKLHLCVYLPCGRKIQLGMVYFKAPSFNMKPWFTNTGPGLH